MLFRRLNRFTLAFLAGIAGADVPAAADDKQALSTIVEAWLAAPHGDYHSRSFTYWNKDGEVPVACAACHSEQGFLDYLGADGSPAGVVDKPSAINSPIGCASCHTGAAHALDSISFPSGTVVDGLGSSALCSVCHQGRQSAGGVAKAVAGLDDDTVQPALAFLNVHYGIAAAVMHGADVQGGYQYPDKAYAGRFMHVPSASSCTSCHEAHSTTVATDSCFACHGGVTDTRSIRTRHTDFDGDGDASGGIHQEIFGLHKRLNDAIRKYAAEISGNPIVYAKDSFPYFFNDTDGDGQIAPEDAVMANRYASWTPRLLKAAYNYQFVAKDGGGYVHNPAYLLQLLHDSLESLSQRVETDMADIRRP